jgi:Putative metal-binding motif/FG-GAP repeat
MATMPQQPSFLALLVLFATAPACRNKDSTSDDLDGDGYAAADDCDDTDANSFPGATEACDGADNDCNGLVDDGVGGAWYVDVDADGFGDRDSAPVTACSDPGGYAGARGDCNDSDPDTYPGAPELCDLLDNDCDGQADDGVGQPYYTDADGDGFGTAGTGEYSCDGRPAGTSANYRDCDDTDSAVNPNATEVCGDLDDDDCDGNADVGVVGLWYSDDDGDGYGDPSLSETTCEPQSGWVQDNTDCQPYDAAAYPGAPESCNDIDDNCDGVVDDGMDVDGDGHRTDACVDGTDCDDLDADVFPDSGNDVCGDGIDQDCTGSDRACGFEGETLLSAADAHIYGTMTNYSASTRTDIGDPTGDGNNDLLSSTHTADSWGGGGYLVPGPVTGSASYSDVGYHLSGDSTETYGAGWSMGIGDINGDGVDDVGFGAPWAPYGGMFIEYGPVTSDRSLTDADLWLACIREVNCGYGSDIGDFTGDGIADAAVGARLTGWGTGTVYLLEGPVTAETELEASSHSIDGEAASTMTGSAVHIGGDINGDGIDDILVSAPYATGRGALSGIVYLVLGPGTGVGSMASADARLLGPCRGGYLGEGGTMSAQDVDGDGYADPAMGSFVTASGGRPGGAYLVFGPLTGDVDLRGADVIVEGVGGTDYIGPSVGHGDIDGNGTYEFLVGSSSDSSGAGGGGAAYLFTSLGAGTYTTADADAWFVGDSGGAAAGSSVYMGDLNGDGRDDVAVGAPNDSTGAREGGGVFVHFARD